MIQPFATGESFFTQKLVGYVLRVTIITSDFASANEAFLLSRENMRHSSAEAARLVVFALLQ